MQDDEFEWDDDKAYLNRAIHEVSFEEARLVFSDIHAVELGEDRRGYDEQRFRIIGRSGPSLLVVIYSERGGRTRIISARRAERAERNNWIRENPPFG
jgi:uncharacterized DUF497 family protein